MREDVWRSAVGVVVRPLGGGGFEVDTIRGEDAAYGNARAPLRAKKKDG